MQEKTPWILAKENKIDKLSQVLSDLLYIIKTSSILFFPFMTNISLKILSCFNEDEKDLNENFQTLLRQGQIYIKAEEFSQPEILFKKIQ